MHVKEIQAQELANLISTQENLRLIDVRSLNEINRGGLENAEHLPLHLLPLRAFELSKEDPIVFYCHSGARSAQACAFLKSKGHENVINLRGGILNWAHSGLPIKFPIQTNIVYN